MVKLKELLVRKGYEIQQESVFSKGGMMMTMVMMMMSLDGFSLYYVDVYDCNGGPKESLAFENFTSRTFF